MKTRRGAGLSRIVTKKGNDNEDLPNGGRL